MWEFSPGLLFSPPFCEVVKNADQAGDLAWSGISWQLVVGSKSFY
jgi:hypothetical protein